MSIGYVLRICILKIYFHFFSGQLVVLLSLAVRLALYCLSVVRFTTTEQ